MTLLTDPDEIIAKVQAPRVEEVEEEPVVAEGEEGAEGEEAAEGAEAAEGQPAERRLRRGLTAAARRRLAVRAPARRVHDRDPEGHLLGPQRHQPLAERRARNRRRSSRRISSNRHSSSNSVRNAM